ncbi:MAG: RNB domain-containing ribonuclease [Opitutae bacterium]|nr:RNB domain-containing ribonuclease [Opitutae bacterium]
MKKRRKPAKDRKTYDVKGVLHFRRSGAATLVTGGSDPETYRIHSRDTGTALHMDEVQARLSIRQGSRHKSKSNRHDKPDVKARVDAVLKRSRDSLVGTLFWDGANYFVMPDEPRITQKFSIARAEVHGMTPRPKMKDKVVIQIKEWKDAKKPPRGSIIEVLGKTHTPIAEYRAILREFDLDPDFPKAVEKETGSIHKRVLESETNERFDARKIFTVTIDPDDAKDFDDALSVEKIGENKFRIGVHIADVSHYVKPDSQLDIEAKKRGNSTYLVGTVIPMLPHPLSSGICSLVEGQDRLVKTAFLTFDKEKLIKTQFENSVICSRKRLTYKQAITLLEKEDINAIRNIPAPAAHQTGHPGKDLGSLPDKEIHELQKVLRTLWRIASSLRQERMTKGSLDLDMPETKILVDKDGWADRIEKIQNDESHQLIEEFMLLANEEIAKLLRTKSIPGIFRTHDNPDEEKLNDYRKLLGQWGIKAGDLTNRIEVTRALATIKKHPQSHMLHIEFLRSLPKACYRASADGHYGLNKGDYTHFTSPIRRYSDLIVHRILGNFIARKKKQSGKAEPQHLRKGRLEEVSQHLSLTERNSINAERESVRIKLLEFFERELKKKPKTVFIAVIMDIGRGGVFVELKDSGAYGMLIGTGRGHGRSWNSENAGTSISLGGQTLLSGGEINVVIDSVDRFLKQINFSLASKDKK